LAYIQAGEDEVVSQEDIINFLKCRNRAVINMAGDYANWESMVKSGIPLSSSKALDDYIDPIKESIKVYKESDCSAADLAEFSKSIEELIQKLPTVTFKHDYEEAELDEVRLKWFSAKPLSEIAVHETGQEICVSYISMTLPWAINAITRKLFDLELDEEAELLEELALYCEIGVPNMDSVKIYLAGLKSRVTAFELSKVLVGKLTNLNKSKLIKLLKDNSLNIELLCDEVTNKWVELFTSEQEGKDEDELTQISNFVLNNTESESQQLNVRSFNGNLYLCNADLTEKISITSNDELPFESITDNPKIYFEKEGSHWAMRVRGQAQTSNS
jgi:hypothetical protein